MKSFLLTSLGLVFITGNAFTQGACSDIKIETPVVPKPTQGAIVTVTCKELVVVWKGNADQTYIVQGTYKNISTNKTDTAVATNTSCDAGHNCTATIPVSAGIKITWTIQASEEIDDRPFYSYPFRGDQDYTIPACKTAAAKSARSEQTLIIDPISKNKLVVYPNPVTGELTINWSSEYNGDATISILDAVGKQVKRINIKKEQAIYSNRLQVSSLSSGIYYLNIRTTEGELLTTRFVKE